MVKTVLPELDKKTNVTRSKQIKCLQTSKKHFYKTQIYEHKNKISKIMKYNTKRKELSTLTNTKKIPTYPLIFSQISWKISMLN